MKVTKTTNADRTTGFARIQGGNSSQNARYTVYGANGTPVGVIKAYFERRHATSGAWEIIDTYHGYKTVKTFFGSNAFKQAKAWAEDDGNWFEAWVKSGDLKLTLELS